LFIPHYLVIILQLLSLFFYSLCVHTFVRVHFHIAVTALAEPRCCAVSGYELLVRIKSFWAFDLAQKASMTLSRRFWPSLRPSDFRTNQNFPSAFRPTLHAPLRLSAPRDERNIASGVSPSDPRYRSKDLYQIFEDSPDSSLCDVLALLNRSGLILSPSGPFRYSILRVLSRSRSSELSNASLHCDYAPTKSFDRATFLLGKDVSHDRYAARALSIFYASSTPYAPPPYAPSFF